MDKALSIARLAGPMMAALGIGLLTSPAAYREIAQQFVATPSYIYFSGMLLLAAGLTILNAHPWWTRDWRAAVTLLGWVLTCVGFFRVIAPAFVNFVGSSLFASQGFFIAAGAFFLAAGSFFTFKGYVASEVQQ